MKTWYVFLVILIPFSGSSQHESDRSNIISDSLLGLHYYQIADTFYMKVDSCIRYTNLALPLLKKTNQWEKYVDAITALSYCYNVKGLMDSLIIVNEFAYNEANRYLPRGHQVNVAILNNLGISNRVVYQDYDEAIRYFKAALSLYDHNSNLLSYQGNILKNIGEVLILQGEFKNAELYFKEALANYVIAFRDSRYKAYNVSFRIAEMYQNLAKVARYQGEFPTANQYLQKMLTLMQVNANPFASSYYLYCYTQLAEISLQLEDEYAAEKYIQKAFSLSRLTPDQNAEVHSVHSQWLAEKGEWRAALEAIEQSLEFMSAEKAVDFAKRQEFRATCLMHTGQLKAALQATTDGVIRLSNATDWDQLTKRPIENWNITSPLACIELMETRALIQQRLATTEKEDIYWDKALESYHYLSELGDQLRRNYQSEESKLFLSANSHDYYEAAISLAYQLYQKTNRLHYANEALYFFEQSKASVLLEELMAHEAEGRSALPPSIIAQGQDLKIELNYYRKLIDGEEARGESADQHKIANWNSHLLQLTRERESWQRNIEQHYPEYQVYTQSSFPSVAAIQKQLQEQQGLATYFAGNKDWYFILLQPNEVRFQRLDNPNAILDLQRTVLNHLKMTSKDGISAYTKAASELFEVLLPDIPVSELDHLLVIPDGQLAFLPFDLLLSAPVTETNVRSFPFLFRQLSISYAYSWAIQNINRANASFNGQFLHIAPVFVSDPNRHLPLSELPLSATQQWNTASLVKQSATKRKFIDIGQQYGLIHFASHASAYDSILHEPAIDFVDEPLYLRDLQSMRLSAHLVVLSACDAGIGDVRQGEGIMSLARGFAYSGVPSVVSTLWKINEHTTHRLLDRFYSYLAEGKSKDQALRLAKIEFIEECSDIQLAPYYWAGLVAIGDMQPIAPLSFWSRHYELLLLFLLGLLGLTLILLRKKNK